MRRWFRMVLRGGWGGLLVMTALTLLLTQLGMMDTGQTGDEAGTETALTPAGGNAYTRPAEGEIVLDKRAPSLIPDVPPIPEDHFVVFITGNWSGKLGPCGCADEQLGGIDRRTHILRQVPEERRLLIDAGPRLEKQGRQAEFKLETFMYSMDYLGFDAIAMIPTETSIMKRQLRLSTDEHPAVVGSNMYADQREEYEVLPYVRKTLKCEEYELECVVLSLYDPEAADGMEKTDIELNDPLEALEETLAALGIGAEEPSDEVLVIVLVPTLSPDVAEQLRMVAALDIVARQGITDEPERIGQTAATSGPVVVTTGKMGKYLLRFDLPPGGQANMAGHAFHAVAIKDVYPRDPAVLEFFDEYQLQLQIENLIADETKIPRMPLPEENRFIGSKACGESGCHEDIYNEWKHFRHARAMESLLDPNVNQAYDPECVVCHTVGMLYETGYREMEQEPFLGNVGCEMCHGPGYYHMQDEYAEYKVQFTRCEDCHDHDHSPQFLPQRAEYFEKIKHWEEPRKYWQ